MALLVPAPTEFGVQEGAVPNPLFPVGIGYRCSAVCVWDPLPHKRCLRHWDLVGAGRQQVSAPWPQNDLVSERQIQFYGPGKGHFSSFEGRRAGGRKGSFYVKKYVLGLRHFLNVIGQVHLPRWLLPETLQAENQTLLRKIPYMRIAAGSPAGLCVPAFQGALCNADFHF